MTEQEWETFKERLLERLDQVRLSGKRTDVLLQLNMVEKVTRVALPPRVQVTEYGV